MRFYSLLAGVALSSFSTVRADSPDSADVVFVTVKQVVFTCPCDDSKSTSFVKSWNAWENTVTNGPASGIPKTSSTPIETDNPVDSPAPSPDAVYCYTALRHKGEKSLTTSTTTITTSCTSAPTTTTTITTTETTTPSTITSTDTETTTTSTTGLPTTDTITQTVTTDTTTTTTEVITETDTETDTTSTTSTSTIPTSAGFTPIDVSSPGASGPADPGNKIKRDFDTGFDHSFNEPFNGNFGGLEWYGLSGNMTAGDVTCYITTDICSTVTSTAMTTLTSTASTPSTTVTTTNTITVTIIPGVSTTVTDTATNTITETDTTTTTTTTTTTSTSTSIIPYYAACDPNTNQAYYINGVPVVGGLPDYSVLTTNFNGATTPYDCCVAAILDPMAAIWGFITNPAQCYIFEQASACPNGQTNTVTNTNRVSQASTTPAAVNGNANCGVWGPVTTVS